MSQSNPSPRTNRPQTFSIDSAGTIAEYRIAGYDGSWIVSLMLNGTAPASYRIDFGGENEAGETQWFEDSEYAFAATDEIRRGWQQPEPRMRIVVTDPAPSGATADVLVARGR